MNTMTTATSTTTNAPTAAAALTHLAACRVCGASMPALLLTGTAAPACPACVVQSGTESAAADHLAALLIPAVKIWAAHWEQAGLSLGTLRSLLELEGGQWSFTDPLSQAAPPR